MKDRMLGFARRLNMNRKRVAITAIAVLLVVVIFASNFQDVIAAAYWAVTPRKVVDLNIDQAYDIYFGNSGVYISDSRYNGTAVLERPEHPPNQFGRRVKFSQRLVDFNIYESYDEAEGRGTGKSGTVVGIMYVYFNLDVRERRNWDFDTDDRMSIWYMDYFIGRWVKCPTFLRRDVSAPRGRLVCYLTQFGTYGLGLEDYPLIIHLVKLGLVTLTPTRTPTPTP